MATVHRITTRLLLVILIAAVQFPLGSSAAAEEITQRELLQRLDRNDVPFIVDVRRADEFAAGHVPGAVNIPHSEIAARLDELRGRRDSEVVVYCESGRRAAIAQGILEKAGFTRVKHLQGDMRSWRERGLPYEHPRQPLAPARQ
jgi:phage shock protein E